MQPVKVAEAMSPGKRTRGGPLIDRFLKYVRKTESCWMWTGAVHHNGYGQICIGRKAKTASRVSYELFVGPISDGLQALHKCDTPLCVNPDHLFLGTNADNVKDRVSKNRSAVMIGSKNANAKLSVEDVVEIRRLRAAGVGPTEIGKRYGVAREHVQRIVRGKAWSQLS